MTKIRVLKPTVVHIKEGSAFSKETKMVKPNKVYDVPEGEAKLLSSLGIAVIDETKETIEVNYPDVDVPLTNKEIVPPKRRGR